MSRYANYGQGDTAPGPQREAAPDGDVSFVGVSQRVGAEKLGPGLIADGQNVRMRNGEVETRLGVVKPGWLNGTLSAAMTGVGTFYGAGVFKDPNGEEWVLEAADGGVYRCKPGNARFAMALPTAVRVLADCSFCQAFNQIYLFRGKYLQPLVMTSVDTGFVDVVARWSSAGVYNALVIASGQVAQEVAYGPYQAVTSVVSVGDLATVTTTAEHGYVSGMDVTIAGAVEAAYNGRWNITVLDSLTFTFHFTGATSPATGTIKVSNNAYYWSALGSRVTLTALTHVTVVATATKNAHGFSNGQYVTIVGANVAAYNGVFVISNVTANTFDYTMASDPGANAAAPYPTARTSVTLAGQSPDTNPEAWTRVWNVLPNADDGVFISNRMLVATSWTPGANGYDSTSVYTKKDFIVAMDRGDNVHFAFTNEFRINQGDDSEIAGMVKYNQDQAIVVKGKTWGVLGGLSGVDYSTVTWDSRGEQYGGTGLRCAVVAGKNVLFASPKRGIASLAQNELGQIRGTDVPFSNDITSWIGRVNWPLASKIRMAWWDDKLYVAAPLDDGVCYGADQIALGTVNNTGAIPLVVMTGFVPGQTYRFKASPVPHPTIYLSVETVSEGVLFQGQSGGWLNTGNVYYGGDFVARQSTYYFLGTVPNVTSSVRQVTVGVNNAILVYDFRSQAGSQNALEYDFQSGQWASLDTGPGICPKEFFLAFVNGQERLFFIGSDGYANMVEESWAGDQVGNAASATGLGFAEITSEVTTRGYGMGGPAKGMSKWRRVELVVEVWNAVLNIWRNEGGAHTATRLVNGLSFSRTGYLKPVGKAAYVDGNGNGDWATKGRGDYSVTIPAGGLTQGVGLQQFQEIIKRLPLSTVQGRFAQYRIQCTQGRMRVKVCVGEGSEGVRRDGVVV